jgi:hypothetical protein
MVAIPMRLVEKSVALVTIMTGVVLVYIGLDILLDQALTRALLPPAPAPALTGPPEPEAE